MPQVAVNSSNIKNFGFSMKIDPYARTMFFDTSVLSTYNGSGKSNVQGIGFSVKDKDGVEVISLNYATQIPAPATADTYTADLSSLGLQFFFNGFSITGYIKDQNGTVYQTPEVFKSVCQPTDINESGYVPGVFAIQADCANNLLTVKELTTLVYSNEKPTSVTKTGILSYPTGTITPVAFTGTPFSNNPVYSGEYRINCTTIAIYDLGDNIFVSVTYITNSPFPVACSNFLGDVACCLSEVYNTYVKNCGNAKGQNALEKYNSVAPALMLGILKQNNGLDASEEAAYIKKTLKCDCGTGAVHQNEMNPTSPAVYNIVITGTGGTTVTPSITGTTKTYQIGSNIYQVVKGVPGDLAFSITTDTSTTGVIKYVIAFDYAVIAATVLTAIGADPVIKAQLNALVTATGSADLTGLDGKCVIDTTKKDYSLALAAATSSTLVASVVIDGVTYTAPANTHVNTPSAVQSWLNTLSKGTFACVFSGGTFTVISVANTHTVATMTFSAPGTTVAFASTNITLVNVLNAIVNYLCGVTALQVALGQNLAVCFFDYSGQVYSVNFQTGQKQSELNTAVTQAICNLAARINTLTGVTCASIANIFKDSPTSVLGGGARLYGKDGGLCVAWTPRQLALGVIAAINANADVKAEFCSIDCSIPAQCPDISGASINMVGTAIGIYGVTFSSTPQATQVVTVQYKLTSTATWTTATTSLQILPNGNINGTTPYQIPGVVAGQTYDVRVFNNCGGVGFTGQITVPTGAVYSGSFRYDASIYAVCGNVPGTLYSSAPFGVGVTMYTNAGLTTALTGKLYIADASGAIYNINTSTGVVGAATGSSCNTGTVGKYILANSTIAICSGTVVLRYTSGAFAVGKTLYVDSALTTPVTGYSYAYHTGTAKIYNLNSSTGVIGADTGAACSAFANSYAADTIAAILCNAALTTYYTSTPFFGPGVTIFTNIGLTTPLTGKTYIMNGGTVYTIDPVTGEVNSTYGACTVP